jgi:membrane protease YdiL (CAAX protease family)
MVRHKILAIAIIMEGALAVLAFLLYLYFDLSAAPLSDNFIRNILLGTAGAVPPAVFFIFSMSDKAASVPFIGSLRKKVLSELKAVFDKLELIDLVIISLLAGIAEEFMFRGVIQARFGIITASILFGVAHCISLAYIIAATVMGLYIGAIYAASGSLVVPVQIHFVYDLFALIYLRYFIHPVSAQETGQ